jgi:hypothetical protein
VTDNTHPGRYRELCDETQVGRHDIETLQRLPFTPWDVPGLTGVFQELSGSQASSVVTLSWPVSKVTAVLFTVDLARSFSTCSGGYAHVDWLNEAYSP